MQLERIEELQSAQIDFDADGAAEALAWTWTANECWSRRLIGDTPEQDRAIFEERLPAAREHVDPPAADDMICQKRRTGDAPPNRLHVASAYLG